MREEREGDGGSIGATHVESTLGFALISTHSMAFVDLRVAPTPSNLNIFFNVHVKTRTNESMTIDSAWTCVARKVNGSRMPSISAAAAQSLSESWAAAAASDNYM